MELKNKEILKEFFILERAEVKHFLKHFIPSIIAVIFYYLSCVWFSYKYIPPPLTIYSIYLSDSDINQFNYETAFITGFAILCVSMFFMYFTYWCFAETWKESKKNLYKKKNETLL